MNSGGSARTARAALFALVCVGAGTALHRVADGCDPGWVGPALALPVAYLASFGLARRERHPLVVTLVLGIAQLCLHVELGWFCPPGQGAMPGMQAGFGASATAAASSAGVHSATAMLAAHALAVLICGCWLGLGERSFFELCRVLATLARRAADRTAVLLAVHRAFRALPISTRPARIHATARHTARPRGRPAPSPRILRGPPLSLVSH